MLLANEEGHPIGVRCDLTGEELRNRFTYYSVTGSMVLVDGQSVSARVAADLDLDICEGAYQALLSRCREHLGPPAGQASVRCDLSGMVLSGQFKYWSIVFDKVEVDIESESDTTVVTRGMMDMNICEAERDELMGRRTWNRKT